MAVKGVQDEVGEVFREGEFGPHCTMVGKIVYKRPRHYFGYPDIQRLLTRLEGRMDVQDEEMDEEVPWWIELLNWIGQFFTRKILAFVGFDDKATSLAWNGLNSLWNHLLSAMLPGYDKARVVHDYFEQRFKRALQEYTSNGDERLLSALTKDLLELED